MAIDSFGSAAKQEAYVNNANDQLEMAEDAQNKGTAGTIGGMAAAQAIETGMATGAATGAGTAAAGTAAATTTAAGTTAAAGTGAGGLTTALAAVPGWGWAALAGMSLLYSAGVFD